MPADSSLIRNARSAVGEALRRGEHEAAIREALAFQTRVQSDPHLNRAPFMQAALGDLWSALGDYAQSASCYSAAIELSPETAVFWFNRAAVRRFLGDLTAAESDYDQVIRLSPYDAYAHLNRAELRTQTVGRNHVEELESALREGSDDWRYLVPMHYALGKEYEDLGDYSAAWLHFAAGAGLRRRHLQYDLRRDLDTVEWLREAFHAPGMYPGHDSSAPIFILGMPRTGSTLVETLLGNHSSIRQGGELQDFGLSLISLVRARLGRECDRRELVFESSALDPRALAAAYLRRTRWLGRDARHFTDKLPLNYLYAGLIARAFPRAAMFHVVRDPMATCFGIYKVLFDQGYPFSYDLDEIGEYYCGYARLMEHWKSLWPGRLIEVSYESLTARPAAEAQRLVEAIGLPWQAECANVTANTNPSTTASASQIRSPIHRDRVDRWRHYEAHLEPLARKLRGAGLIA
ncbi:MAG: sulfotransferase [Gammaproteobacteria bacterium]|nr:sulfotransferase [Gammaproteobacteria bacterium]